MADEISQDFFGCSAAPSDVFPYPDQGVRIFMPGPRGFPPLVPSLISLCTDAEDRHPLQLTHNTILSLTEGGNIGMGQGDGCEGCPKSVRPRQIPGRCTGKRRGPHTEGSCIFGKCVLH